MIKLMFAHGPSGEFGKNGALPWNEPEDLKNFKAYTKDCILLMGSNTFKSLPGVLPGRMHVVIGSTPVTALNGASPHRQFTLPEGITLKDVCDDITRELGVNVCIIGGVSMIEEAASFVDEANVTLIHDVEPGADVFIDAPKVLGTLSDRNPYIQAMDLDYGLVHIVNGMDLPCGQS